MSDAFAWGAATDVGRVRDSNEDAFVAESMVFGVADGMGGHQAGEVASAIAANTLRDRLAAGSTSVEVVVAAVVEANAAIFQEAHRNSEQRGMGTTLTALAVVITDDATPRLAAVNVGDSRTYLLRAGVLSRVSVDHSYVQELVSTGHITEAEARLHPRRNIITRALGIDPSVRVDDGCCRWCAGIVSCCAATAWWTRSTTTQLPSWHHRSTTPRKPPRPWWPPPMPAAGATT